MKGLFLIVSASCMVVAQAPKFVPTPPVQPLPYSHKLHLAKGLECKNCHSMPEPGDFATLPATSTCMACHVEIKKESPSIQKLAEYHAKKDEIPWKRVYRIPDFVFFSHKTHVTQAKATCETCHGVVREMEVMRKEKDTTMAACVECHRAADASIACNYCHEPR